jgi:hypothetical protein
MLSGLAGTVLGALVYEALRGGEEYPMEVPEGIFQGIKKRMKKIEKVVRG